MTHLLDTNICSPICGIRLGWPIASFSTLRNRQIMPAEIGAGERAIGYNRRVAIEASSEFVMAKGARGSRS